MEECHVGWSPEMLPKPQYTKAAAMQRYNIPSANRSLRRNTMTMTGSGAIEIIK